LFSVVHPRFLLRGTVIRSESRSRAELNCALPWVLRPSHQRDTADRPVGAGRLRARRRFGYWGEQIGRLRGQSSHHFGARRQKSSPQQRVGVETAMETLSLPVVRRLIAEERHQGRRFESLPRYIVPLFPKSNYIFCDFVRSMLAPSTQPAMSLGSSQNGRYGRPRMEQTVVSYSLEDVEALHHGARCARPRAAMPKRSSLGREPLPRRTLHNLGRCRARYKTRDWRPVRLSGVVLR
jgi:hypothetical protein